MVSKCQFSQLYQRDADPNPPKRWEGDSSNPVNQPRADQPQWDNRVFFPATLPHPTTAHAHGAPVAPEASIPPTTTSGRINAWLVGLPYHYDFDEMDTSEVIGFTQSTRSSIIFESVSQKAHRANGSPANALETADGQWFPGSAPLHTSSYHDEASYTGIGGVGYQERLQEANNYRYHRRHEPTRPPDNTLTLIISEWGRWHRELFNAVIDLRNITDKPGSPAVRIFEMGNYDPKEVEAAIIILFDVFIMRCKAAERGGGFHLPDSMNHLVGRSFKKAKAADKDASCWERLHSITRILRTNKRVCRDIMQEKHKAMQFVNAPLHYANEKDLNHSNNDRRRQRTQERKQRTESQDARVERLQAENEAFRNDFDHDHAEWDDEQDEFEDQAHYAQRFFPEAVQPSEPPFSTDHWNPRGPPPDETTHCTGVSQAAETLARLAPGPGTRGLRLPPAEKALDTREASSEDAAINAHALHKEEDLPNTLENSQHQIPPKHILQDIQSQSVFPNFDDFDKYEGFDYTDPVTPIHRQGSEQHLAFAAPSKSDPQQVPQILATNDNEALESSRQPSHVQPSPDLNTVYECLIPEEPQESAPVNDALASSPEPTVPPSRIHHARSSPSAGRRKRSRDDNEGHPDGYKPLKSETAGRGSEGLGSILNADIGETTDPLLFATLPNKEGAGFGVGGHGLERSWDPLFDEEAL